jgi:hypothetical protein
VIIQRVLDLLRQQIGERAASRQLHIAMGVPFDSLESLEMIGSPEPSWMPSLTATMQRPRRS